VLAVRAAPAAGERITGSMPAPAGGAPGASLLKDRMSTFSSDRRRSRLPIVVVLLVIVIAALASGGYYLLPRIETERPQIVLSPDVDVLGTAPLEIQVVDKGTGLKAVTATLSQGGTELALASEQFARPVGEKKIAVTAAKVSGVKEGPAVLRVTARDASLWRFFSGNEAVLEKNLTIDLTPPTLELIADDRYVNFCGAGAIVYKASADTAASGVKIGDDFFPGFPGQVRDHPEHLLVLFAHPYNASPEARPTLVATDKAGNTREMKLTYELKNVRYRKSTLAISDSFLQSKVAPLLTDVAARQGPPKDVFVAVNRSMREENEDRIAAITKKATPSMLWKDAFAQLSNSKVEANFADQRTYTYGGEVIDTAYHLGYDLSVTKNYPVEAANSGTVTFTGDLGIYGNAVILDHGLGLFTLYGHLSSIDVKVGDSVAKRQVLGKTGETGLAAGDHLHFGVYLHGVAVLPVEWWDPKWIDDNIKPKLEGRSGQEIAEAQQPVKKTRSSGGKRRR
jgi:murein DD-endopeptidase MepM/ murein hydrolase activator NlpD